MLESIRKKLSKNASLLNIWVIIHSFNAPLSVVVKNHKKLCGIRNAYKGKRCFIIGNGPSLKADDLDKIKDEYSFAANSICKIFDRTDWRPSFYCVQDEKVLANLGEDLFAGGKVARSTFIRLNSYKNIRNDIDKLGDLFFVPIIQFKLKNEGVRFSKRIDLYAGDGWTVTYMAIQLAAYMGFKEICLLGVDHSFPFERKKDGSVVIKDLNIPAHFYESAADNVKGEPPRKRANFNERVTNGYIAAEEYSRKTGRFRIYNCTRGGALEVFERKNLEDVL